MPESNVKWGYYPFEVNAMPSNYAHYRFGVQGLPALNEETRRGIYRFRRLYDVGLQGPDPFFYYNPVIRTRVGNMGHKLHMLTGKEFFRRAVRRWRMAPTEGGLSFLYGILGHYCLDSLCHPLVKESSADGRIGHTELETEFDRFLLETDGMLPPHSYDNSCHMRLERPEYSEVARFYTPASTASVRRCVRTMANVTHLIATGNPKIVAGALKAGGSLTSQMIMADTPNPNCAHLNQAMLLQYRRALELYPVLAAQLAAYIRSGTPLGPEFQRIFG